MAGNDREIFEKLTKQGETLARIDERTERMDREWKDSRADHETRLRHLEADNEKRKGIAAAIGAVATLAVNGLIALFKYLTENN